MYKGPYKEYLEHIIESRTNIKQFSDKIPEEILIKQILKKTLMAAPAKSNTYHYEIDVYGPEYSNAKKALLLQTICAGQSVKGTNHTSYGDVTVSDKTIQYLSNWDLDDIFDQFNVVTQVLAPYLLVYKHHEMKHNPGLLDDSSFDSRREPGGREHAAIQASMHAIILTLIASIYGVDHGFCRCYKYAPANKKNVIFNEPVDNLIFFVGLGYRQENPYPSKKNITQAAKVFRKPLFNQIYDWKKK